MFAVKRMPVSPQNVPDEVMKIHFLRTQSRGMHLFNILVTEWRSSERFRCTRRLCRGNTCESAVNWSNGCSVDRRGDARERWTQTAINVHLGLGYRADSFRHTNKWACGFKADNWQGQLVRKTQTFKQKNENFGKQVSATRHWTTLGDFPEEMGGIINKSHFFILCNEMVQHRELHLNQYFPTNRCLMSPAGVWLQDSPVTFRVCNSQGEIRQWVFRSHAATNL